MSINEVRYLTECGSTNAYVKEHFEEFGPVGAVYTTNQTAGRGRLGRTWVNAEGRALYYTVAIREPLAQPATLPLLASLAVRRQLALCYEAGSWYDGHKGILAASAGCGRADLTAVEQEILRQLAELAEGRFSQAELEIARAGLLSDLRLLCDSPGRLDEFYTGRAAAGISQSPAELAAAVRAVPAEDICAAARQVRPDTVYTLEEA